MKGNKMTSNDQIKDLNSKLLSDAQREKGYIESDWATWKGWQDRGRLVKHGEKGTKIYSYPKDPETDAQGKLLKGFVGKTYHVFNIEQTEEL